MGLVVMGRRLSRPVQLSTRLSVGKAVEFVNVVTLVKRSVSINSELIAPAGID